METLIQDVRYAFRILLRSPGLSFIVIIALALGIGANTAIFTVVNSVLIRPLPFSEPHELALVYATSPQEGMEKVPLCLADFLDWKSQNRAHQMLAAFSTNRFNYTDGESPERIDGAWVTADFFATLGVQAQLGRTFFPDEDEPGQPWRVVISDGFWKRRLGSDPGVIDQQITLNGRPFTLVGVMPPGFSFPEKEVELWVAERLEPPTRRGPYYMFGLARLAPGTTIEQSRAELAGISKGIQQSIPNQDRTWTARPLTEAVVGDVRPVLMVLLAAVLFVLLIASANVANLLLARATAREKEMSIRVALGASRGRLIRQLLTESLVLAVAGGAAGLLLALWGVDLLLALSADTIPRIQEVRIDERVLGFTTLIAVASGIVFGLAPAIQFSRSRISDSLKEGGRISETRGRRRLRSALVLSELALSLILLIGAGLMIKSFSKLQSVSPGFNPANILTMHLTLPRARYDKEEKVAEFYRTLIERVESVPGVQAAGLSISLPPRDLEVSDSFTVEGRPTPPGEIDPNGPVVFTDPAYFSTLGIPLIRGRYFSETDNAKTPLVVIVNENLAEQFIGGEDPIGKRLKVGGADRPNAPWMEIVGVVGDVRYSGLDSKPQPTYYVPLSQNTWRSAYLVVRSQAAPSGLVQAIRNEVRSLDGTLPVARTSTMDRLMAESVAQPRFRTLVLAVFAFVAMVLAAVGIYGVISYSVTQRTREIGVRMALGAKQASVLKMVLTEGLKLAAIGVALGLAGSYFTTQVLSGLLFEVSVTDTLVFVVISTGLASLALAASYFPARRATRVDPIVALRCE